MCPNNNLRRDSQRHATGFTMTRMAKKRKGDRHLAKPFMIRMHPVLRKQLELLVEMNVTSTMTHEIVEAIKERLRVAGLWPPPPEDRGKK